MLNRTIRVVLVSMLVFVQVGCSVNKGYRGEELDASQLATIIYANNIGDAHPDMHKDKIFISHVGDLEVGSFYKEWPVTLDVKPGLRVISFKLFRAEPTDFGHLLSNIILGSTVGIMVMPNARQAVEDAPTIKVEAAFEAGKKYRVGLRTIIDDDKNSKTYVWVFEFGTGKVVGGQKPIV